MDEKKNEPSTAETRERAGETADSTQPRGNPETDHESVKKGQEQLGKISGN